MHLFRICWIFSNNWLLAIVSLEFLTSLFTLTDLCILSPKSLIDEGNNPPDSWRVLTTYGSLTVCLIDCLKPAEMMWVRIATPFFSISLSRRGRCSFGGSIYINKFIIEISQKSKVQPGATWPPRSLSPSILIICHNSSLLLKLTEGISPRVTLPYHLQPSTPSSTHSHPAFL